MVGTDVVGPELMKKVAGDQPYHTLSTLDGVLTEKSYVSVRHMQDARGNNSGYLFLCSSGARLTDFKEEFWSNFFFSACVMLLCASVLTSFLMRKLTDPLQKITDAAQRFGGGDFSVRVEGVPGGHAGAGQPPPLPRAQSARHGCPHPRRGRRRADELAVRRRKCKTLT